MHPFFNSVGKVMMLSALAGAGYGGYCGFKEPANADPVTQNAASASRQTKEIGDKIDGAIRSAPTVVHIIKPVGKVIIGWPFEIGAWVGGTTEGLLEHEGKKITENRVPLRPKQKPASVTQTYDA